MTLPCKEGEWFAGKCSRREFTRKLAKRVDKGKRKVFEESVLTHFTLAILFAAQKQACGPGARVWRAKSIGRLNCGFRIADFGF
jgi:hypothetical protein